MRAAALALGCRPIGVAIIAALRNCSVEHIVAADFSTTQLADTTMGAPVCRACHAADHRTGRRGRVDAAFDELGTP
jgi:threonine dehydrogenase-like Zn-dependent dehydrogenase